VVIAIILIGSGFVSLMLIQQSGHSGPAVPGMLIQTDNPDASVLVATPQKGALFVALIVVLLGSLGAVATGIAFLFWLLNRQITVAAKIPNAPFSFALNTAQPHSLGYVVARRPVVTISVALVLVLGAAITAALLGLFSTH
jgi:hypothetical protein